MKLDILVGLESIRGKFILVDRLGRSLFGFLKSRDEGFGSFLSLLAFRPPGPALSRPLPRTKWLPPGGGFGNILPVPVYLGVAQPCTGVLLIDPALG